MELGRFENYESMQRASERFLVLLGVREPVAAANDTGEGRLSCGHSHSRGHLINGTVTCRTCDARAEADYRRQQRLPEVLANTRQKLQDLEAEARRRGQIA